MKRLLLMLLITCATAGIANAQLGKLKDLAKKAGNAAKEQVQKNRQAAEKVQNTKQTVEVKESLEDSEADIPQLGIRQHRISGQRTISTTQNCHIRIAAHQRVVAIILQLAIDLYIGHKRAFVVDI